MKIRVRYSDGKFRGAFMDLERFDRNRDRAFDGAHDQNYFEYLWDLREPGDEPTGWCTLHLARDPVLEGPAGDEVDTSSRIAL